MDRRQFLKSGMGFGGMALASPLLRAANGIWASTAAYSTTAHVAFVKTSDRAAGVNHAIDLLGMKRFGGKDIFIKPNFNSADTPPGSTHNDTLVALIRKLNAMGAGPLTIGDRSGMGNTREVMERKDAFTLAKELSVKAIVLDELPAGDWHVVHHPDMHWERGFALPSVVRNAGGVITTCCLKTHRYGGHFTLSLKNSVGLAAKRVPGDSYNYMNELHSSPHQRRMIAEINAAYAPELIVLDGVEAFATGGPESGKLVRSNVILAGTDRVAIDAVGVALLRYFGTTPEVSRGEIFEQDQIARAVQLGIGVGSARQIELVTGDRDSAEFAKPIRAILDGSPS
jgi:uncharacterized protein (DUF362 family)